MKAGSDNRKLTKFFQKWVIVGASIVVIGLFFLYFDRLTCSGAHASIHCLANHPFAFQLINQAGNPVLDAAMAKVASAPCSDAQFTSDTLAVAAAVVPNNVHYSEEAAELVDSILVDHPECFLEASENVEQKRRMKLNHVLDALEDTDSFKSKGRESMRRFDTEMRFKNSLRDFHILK